MFTATGNGVVTAYFYSSNAGNDDEIILWDKTSGAMTAPSLDNHSSVVGSSVSLSVKAGDSLIFILDDVTTGQYFSSVDYYGVATPANYNDGYNHAYSTLYSGGVSGIPVGTYVGMEDLGVTGLKPLSGSDLDCNDDNFVFTNVTPQRLQNQARSSSSGPGSLEQPAHSAVSSREAKSLCHQGSAAPENINLSQVVFSGNRS